MTAAEDSADVMDATLGCLRGYADCVQGAREMGVIYGKGVYARGEILDTPQMQQAYDMGHSIRCQ